MELTEFLTKYDLLTRFSEAKIELLLSADYDNFMADVKDVYRSYFVLLNQFLGVQKNFVLRCNNVCSKYVYDRTAELIELNELI